MKNSIFEYRDYKTYLNDTLEKRAREFNERGIRSRLSEAIKCHTAYVSQVLGGNAHFSLGR
jgi:hypothetical protein